MQITLSHFEKALHRKILGEHRVEEVDHLENMPG
jgi:hypothetical protein